jgi:GNAT superfamily N-acetyltransferase
MGITIRPVRTEDAQPLTDFVRELGEFSSIAKESPDVTLRRARENVEIITSSERHTLLVAEDSAQIVGYCSTHWQPMMSQHEGFISELFVKAARRGEGIGTELLENIEKEARARGCGRLHLENFRTKESYGRSYYAKHGWQERSAAASFTLDLRAEAQ